MRPIFLKYSGGDWYVIDFTSMSCNSLEDAKHIADNIKRKDHTPHRKVSFYDKQSVIQSEIESKKTAVDPQADLFKSQTADTNIKKIRDLLKDNKTHSVSNFQLLQEISEMASADLNNVEHEIDQMFRDIGLDVIFSQHFKNRVLDNGETGRKDADANSAARDTDISSNELYNAFLALKKTYGKALLRAKHNREEFIGVLKDMSTKLNIPFTIDYDRVYSGLHKLQASTIMRKGNFVPNSVYDKVLAVKSKELNK